MAPNGDAGPGLPESLAAKAAALGQHLEWDNDHLVVTNPQAEGFERLHRSRLSPSTANAQHGCQARWAVEQVMRGEPDPFSAPDLGSAGHAVLEDLYGRPVGQRTRRDAMELLQDVHERHPELASPNDPIDLALWRDQVAIGFAGVWDIENPDEVLVSTREQHLDMVEISGIPFNGFIDRVDLVNVEGQAGFAIRDWKLGRSKPKSDYQLKKYGDDHGEQIRLYALAKEALDGVLPLEGSLLYGAHGVKRDVDLGKRALNKTRARFEQAHELLTESSQTGRYATKKSGLCAYCPLATVCPTGNAEKPVKPKTEDYHVGEALKIADPVPTVAVPDELADVPPPGDEYAPPTEDVPPPPDEPPYEPPQGWQTPEPATPSSQQVPESNREEEVPEMSELKPWEETTYDGDLNPNSYAATAAFGLAAMAVDTLHKHEVRLTKSNVPALAQTFANAVAEVQTRISGSSGMQEGLNTRLRGALHTSVETLPPPFGGDQDAWNAWYASTVRRIGAIADAAYNLWAARTARPAAPYNALAVDGQSAVA